MAKSAARQLLRMMLGWVKTLILVALGLVPAVWVGDSKGHVNSGEAGYSVVSQWLSCLLWVSAIPYGIWMASLTFTPAIAWGLLVIPATFFLFGRRVSAHLGREMTVREHLVQLKIVSEATWARMLLITGAAISAVGVLLGLLPHWPIAVAAAQGAFDSILPWYPLVTLCGYWLTLPVAARAGYLSAKDSESDADFEAYWSAQVAAILGISATEWQLAGGTVALDPGNVIRAENLPPAARMKFTGIEDRCAAITPGYTVRSVSWDSLVLAPIDQEPDVMAARAAKAESGGLLSGFRNEPDTLARPSAMAWIVADSQRFNAAQLDAYAKTRGARVVELREAEREVVVAELSPLVQQVRARLASLLNASEWAVELSISTAQDGRIQTVEVLRHPNMGADPVRRQETWRQLIAAIPGGSTGWTVADDAVRGRVTLTYGDPRVLPKLIDGKTILPHELGTEAWSEFPIGLNDAGNVVKLSLKAGPHSIVVGGTGAGKSVVLRGVMLNALARGFEVVIIDPVKKAAGLKPVAPWTKGVFTDSREQAAAALAEIYAEVRRRVDQIDAIDGENWRDLPTGSVQPILVVIDEYASLVAIDEKPIGIPPGDPEMVEWSADASAKAKIKATVGKIAREARSAGIHLVLALQRPDAAVIGGSVRENLGSIVQMVVPARPPSPEALRMLFPTDYVQPAMDEIAVLNDGVSPGFALSYIEGGGVQGLRVGFVEPSELAEYPARLGIPLGIPLVLPEAEPAVGTPVTRKRGTPKLQPAPAPEIIDIGEFTFDLDDLAEPTAVTPAPSPASFDEPAAARSEFEFSFDD
jgi:hypothetical protein